MLKSRKCGFFTFVAIDSWGTQFYTNQVHHSCEHLVNFSVWDNLFVCLFVSRNISRRVIPYGVRTSDVVRRQAIGRFGVFNEEIALCVNNWSLIKYRLLEVSCGDVSFWACLAILSALMFFDIFEGSQWILKLHLWDKCMMCATQRFLTPLYKEVDRGNLRFRPPPILSCGGISWAKLAN